MRKRLSATFDRKGEMDILPSRRREQEKGGSVSLTNRLPQVVLKRARHRPVSPAKAHVRRRKSADTRG
jgi:hypothetical protein